MQKLVPLFGKTLMFAHKSIHEATSKYHSPGMSVEPEFWKAKLQWIS